MLFGDGTKRNKFAHAGVGENNIDLALLLSDGLVKTVKVCRFGNVSLHASNVAPDRLHGLVEFLPPTARDENVGALFDEKLCCRESNPFGAAGDDSDLTFELFSHRCFSVAAPRGAPGFHGLRGLGRGGNPARGRLRASTIRSFPPRRLRAPARLA